VFFQCPSSSERDILVYLWTRQRYKLDEIDLVDLVQVVLRRLHHLRHLPSRRRIDRPVK
jgi:hypothetical protein